MGPITRSVIIALAFAAALVLPAFASLLRTPDTGAQTADSCWEFVDASNAGAMWSICSGEMY